MPVHVCVPPFLQTDVFGCQLVKMEAGIGSATREYCTLVIVVTTTLCTISNVTLVHRTQAFGGRLSDHEECKGLPNKGV